MRVLYWALCLVGGIVVAYGILQDNSAAVVIGVLVVLACPVAEWWTRRREGEAADARR